ncbi:sensor histidine kinase NtrY-like [Aureimonas phyllosphaerae]|uniref:histidine kinase n=1 Tax=Aureimonas phyllosphaerae TaxID=1166078 RepID=A0A7W6BRB1_9HYPH|nr:PAS domain-containing sensor histidine kinase [Aureimonas phyllosphaerae]MBB3934865.1 two-component system nitrogen regulation sensor histidine kinase NtrY [Aureimonas phyllosphaerae]MBB3957920.1 two-component system nitrogen regulation sensor histidine kinase NtrY [Aureimonas phyllosphaerae]SFF44222.1 PAS/PAC sensor signal transduction histidine kinase [Aureimonas phyllosphaerae]
MAAQTTTMDGEIPALGERRRFMLVPGILAVIGALVTGAISFVVLMGLTPIAPTAAVVKTATLVNGVFVLLLCVLIAREVVRMTKARRHGKAASRLHVRIVLLFSIVAALPALLVAIVAGITLDLGLDRWFEIRTRTIIDSSINVAEAYVNENARNLQGSTLSMAQELRGQRQLFNLDRTGFQDLLTEQARGRSLLGAQLLNGDGTPFLRADIPVERPLPVPPTDALQQAAEGNLVFIPPGVTNLVGAVMRLREFGDVYLYTIRVVDPEVIGALRLMRERTAEYSSLADNRFGLQIAFALLYLGITLIVLLSAIWTGIGVADRLVRPIRLLISAADEVSEGNLGVSVPVRISDGDVGSLSNTFNNMIRQLRSQRHELVNAKDVIDERRRFTEAVLSGVTAGVMGVDRRGEISMLNPSAERILSIRGSDVVGRPLEEVLPALSEVYAAARHSRRREHQEQIKQRVRDRERTLDVRVTSEEEEAGVSASVVTIDDITDLVDAQRSSAWADVARRIAHEIKNPLTPIQLSAERIRRRYGKFVETDREIFDRCVDTIIRQVADIGRMVDEFSQFARMPKPTLEDRDLREALREAVFMRELAAQGITIEGDFGDKPLMGSYDLRLLSQAFGNLVKNAVEAMEPMENHAGRIVVRAFDSDGTNVVEIEDNGLGFPKEDRDRLLEPYMTTREKGTGLGLAIVRKIVEEHGGTIALDDAPNFDHGALVRIRLPADDTSKTAPTTNSEEHGEH